MDGNSEDTKGEKEKKSTQLTAKHDRVRLLTSQPDLLLAFVYFDQSHAGYLVDRDMEEIVFTLGLQLSRAQVKKLVSKFSSKDMINYRKLTDIPQNLKRVDDSIDTSTTAVSNQDEMILSLGNCQLVVRTERDASFMSAAAHKRPRRDVGDEGAEGPAVEGVVLHNGAFVDIDSVMLNLSNSEKSRISSETKLKELQQELDNLRTSCGSKELANQTMSSEILELKKKLRDQNRVLDETESHATKYKELLLRTHSSLLTLGCDIEDAVSDKDGKTADSKMTDN